MGLQNQNKKVKTQQPQKAIKKPIVEDSDDDEEEIIQQNAKLTQQNQKLPNKAQAKGAVKQQQTQNKKVPQKPQADSDDDEDDDEDVQVQDSDEDINDNDLDASDDDEGNDDEAQDNDDEEDDEEEEEAGNDNQNFEVVVKGLNFDATNKDIEKLFNTFTKVKSVNVLMRGDNTKNRGIAFIKLQDKKALDSALKNNKIEHMGRYLEISVATQKGDGQQQQQGGRQGGDSSNISSVFVGNLSFKTDEDMLRELFEECGDIRNVKVATDRETGKPRGFGHVDFNDSESAQNALKLNGNTLDGRQIKVDLSKPREQSAGGRGGFSGRGGNFRGGDRRGGGGRGGRGGNFRGGDRRGGGGRGGRGGNFRGQRRF